VQRGMASYWSKLSGDSSLYNCSFYPSIDSTKLIVYQVGKFLNYFEANLNVDTGYHNIEFVKFGGTTLNLIGTNNGGQNIPLATGLSLSKTFPKGNPFDTLSKLTDLKDKLNVIGISHFNKPGPFTQFYFPDGQHILTYLPDTLLYSSDFNEFWKADFLKGKNLKPNWNFRKLDGTIDGG
jgi:hypothetical protein